MNEDCLGTALQNLHHIILSNLRLALHDYLITLDGYHLTSILIYEVLVPALQYAGSQLTAYDGLQRLLVHLHLLGEVENLQDVLISLEADGTQQGCYGQLLLTVDIRVHHIINISSELDP